MNIFISVHVEVMSVRRLLAELSLLSTEDKLAQVQNMNAGRKRNMLYTVSLFLLYEYPELGPIENFYS